MGEGQEGGWSGDYDIFPRDRTRTLKSRLQVKRRGGDTVGKALTEKQVEGRAGMEAPWHGWSTKPNGVLPAGKGVGGSDSKVRAKPFQIPPHYAGKTI